MKALLTTVSLAGISFLTASPALAGSPTPGPLLAAGAPALALFAGGYYVVRRLRQG